MMRRLLTIVLVLAGVALGGASHARAEQDAVQFFSNIDVSEDSTVHDAVCFFCSVNVEGKATGDIVVFFGNVHIASDAQHDVVNFFGNVTADENASIDHDLVSMFGNVRLGDNVHVGEDLVTMFGVQHLGEGVSIEGSRVAQPPILFWAPLIVVFIVFFVVVREYRAYRRRLFLRGYGFPPRP